MEINSLEIIILTIVGGLGAAVFFVGWLFSGLIALGNKQYIFGICNFLFAPVSIVYCILNYDLAKDAAKLVIPGAITLGLVAVYVLLFMA